MKPGNAVAWGGPGKVPAHQAWGGSLREGGTVAAGGADYEGFEPTRNGTFQCGATRKDGEPCEAWSKGEEKYCQGHLMQLAKLEKKIASCEDEAERLLLEEERLRKWL